MKIDKAFLLLSGMLIATICYMSVLGTVKPMPPSQPLANFPKQIGGFTMMEAQTFSDEVVKTAGMDEYIMWQYQDKDGYVLGLYIGYYQDQSEGSIIHSPKHCMPGSGWEPTQTDVVTASGAATNRMLLQKGMDKQLAYYWFHGRGRAVANEYIDRAYMVLDSITRRRSDGSLIRIIGSANDLDVAQKKQQGFIASLLPVLDGFLPK